MIYYDIDIISPENTLYEPPLNTGHYPATYSFEDDPNGANPSGWDMTNEQGGDISVVNNLDTHNKLVKMYDTSYTYGINMMNYFSRESGTVEWWFKKTSGSTACIFNFHSDSVTDVRAINFKADAQNNGAFQTRDGGTWIYDYSFSDNTWYRIRIDFECGSGTYMGLAPDTFDVYVNGDLIFDDVAFWFEADHIEKMVIGTNSFITGVFYVDAIGYSWDNYYIGDNKNEGLELVWDCPYDLLATRYNLDNRGWQSVEGITYIPIREEVDHVIKMDGYDAQDRWHRSYDREFYYGYSEKIGVLIYASDAGVNSGNIGTYTDSNINDYAFVLSLKGYTKIYKIKDLVNLETSDEYDAIGDFFNELDIYEWSQDIIFFYLWGHGPLYEEDDYIKIKRTGDDEKYLSSSDFEIYLESLEAQRKGFLVASCKSGDFVVNLQDRQYLAMSVSDESHDSLAWGGEDQFSHYFWESVAPNPIAWDAYGSWAWAVQANLWNPFWPPQYSLYSNNLYDQTGYMFFA